MTPTARSPATISLDTVSPVAGAIRALARRAMAALPRSSPARVAARRRSVRPIDYMRYAEFAAVLHDLTLAPGFKVLDVGSPQWFSLYLASIHPDVAFTYVNIVKSELEPFRDIATALRLDNVDHVMGDVRDLGFQDASFDRAVSISVVEHVYPEAGGDVAALEEVERVLVPGGEFLLTVPYKAEGGVVRVDGPVYERGPEPDNFFAREYDSDMLAELVDTSGLTLVDAWMIAERRGVGSVDYYEWGPGRDDRVLGAIVRSRVLLQALGVSADRFLARRYLRVSREACERLVNASVCLSKPRG